MKTVFLIYSTDAWHSHASKEMIGVYSNEVLAQAALTPVLQRAAQANYKDQGYDTANDLFKDSMYNLKTIKQTQEYDVNYIIEERELNILF